MYIQSCLHTNLPQSFASRGRTKLFCFFSDQKICVEHERNIQGFSRPGTVYNGLKWTIKYLKIPLQHKNNMLYYFLYDIKNIFAKLYQNKPKLSQEIEKNIENVLPSPTKTRLKIAPSNGQPPPPPPHPPIECFSTTTIRVL